MIYNRSIQCIVRVSVCEPPAAQHPAPHAILHSFFTLIHIVSGLLSISILWIMD